MKTFDDFNREERAICSHLFRLLHERRDGSYSSGGLGHFLRLLPGKSIDFQGAKRIFDPADLRFENVAIYCEVSLIRDAYFDTKPDVSIFMDSLIAQVMKQE